MGIIATARTAFKSAVSTFKATNPKYTAFVAALADPTIIDKDD